MAWLYLFGRLKPAVQPAQAEQQLSAMLQGYLRSRGRRDDDRQKIASQRIRVTSGGAGVSSFRSNSRNGLYVDGASVLVRLIAWGNLANLFSFRATRLRLISAAITESVFFSIVGGAAGLIVAYAGTKAILAIVERVPFPAGAWICCCPVDCNRGRVRHSPAWLTTRVAPSDGLRGSSRGVTGRCMRRKCQN
jgi:hypothetical protein